jgi:hypothetical protein
MHQSPQKESARRRERAVLESEAETFRAPRPQAARLRKFPLRDEQDKPARRNGPGGGRP